MAKSTRSKVKRHFRAKKRTEGVYAAVEAARLNRLHNKLKVLTTRDGEEDAHFPEEAADEQGAEQLGWSWFAHFGLYDPADVTPECLHALDALVHRTVPAASSGSSALRRRAGSDGAHASRAGGREYADAQFGHLFPSPPRLDVGSGAMADP
ncbi:uncharacterized protein FIBRA_04941 [Fibroporia radiculosa]|uniref:DUF2423 domain-containing protein n=1 Tax=Fibroporia radiculosa TaxID=599839 RepID=J4H384_9APHY|nr:uncharacterized protein FIBRA_04941 [Fibroporia radiculosa]CCM02829.1 predicted protein [Fibroporia radiculosa]